MSTSGPTAKDYLYAFDTLDLPPGIESININFHTHTQKLMNKSRCLSLRGSLQEKYPSLRSLNFNGLGTFTWIRDDSERYTCLHGKSSCSNCKEQFM